MRLSRVVVGTKQERHSHHKQVVLENKKPSACPDPFISARTHHTHALPTKTDTTWARTKPTRLSSHLIDYGVPPRKSLLPNPSTPMTTPSSPSCLRGNVAATPPPRHKKNCTPSPAPKASPVDKREGVLHEQAKAAAVARRWASEREEAKGGALDHHHKGTADHQHAIATQRTKDDNMHYVLEPWLISFSLILARRGNLSHSLPSIVHACTPSITPGESVLLTFVQPLHVRTTNDGQM